VLFALKITFHDDVRMTSEPAPNVLKINRK